MYFDCHVHYDSFAENEDEINQKEEREIEYTRSTESIIFH